MKIEIPDSIKGNVTVQVNLPPEALTILKDIHADREQIGLGGAILLGCVVLQTLKSIFHSTPSK